GGRLRDSPLPRLAKPSISRLSPGGVLRRVTPRPVGCTKGAGVEYASEAAPCAARTARGEAATMPEKETRPQHPHPTAASSALPAWVRPLTMFSYLATGDDRLIAALALAGLAFYYLVPEPLFALPGLLLFALCAWRRIPLVLCLLPLTFPYWFVPKRVAGHVVFPLSEIALAVCAAVALAQTLERVRRSGL